MQPMSLYLGLKDQLLRKIVDDTYKFGQTLPTEAELCEQYRVSRVTVRKALAELKNDGLLAGVPSQGTVVTRRRGGFRSSLDIIALMAAVNDPFFAVFMEHFERVAEESGSLMLFKQDFQGKAYRSEELFFRFIQRNIRNVVMWPQTGSIDFALLGRLHAVGMNFVFFDQQFDTDVADTVSVDNRDAVSSLYAALRERFAGDIVYVAFAGVGLPSNVQREQAFRDAGGQRVVRLARRGDREAEANRLLDSVLETGGGPVGLLCNSGGVGLLLARLLRARGLSLHYPLATVDFMPEMLEYPMLAYEQPIEALAQKAYQRLAAQNNQGASWQAAPYLIKGTIVACGGGVK